MVKLVDVTTLNTFGSSRTFYSEAFQVAFRTLSTFYKEVFRTLSTFYKEVFRSTGIHNYLSGGFKEY